MLRFSILRNPIHFLPMNLFFLSLALQFFMMISTRSEASFAKKYDPDENKIMATLKSQDQKKMIVAVIDTGFDTNNKFLKQNLWQNSREIPNNGIDDDQNGFIDDINGWNFADNNADLQDSNNHGSHILSILQQSIANLAGLPQGYPTLKQKSFDSNESTASKVQFMILKYYKENMSSKDQMNSYLNAVEYAIKNGAQIINFSGGGYGRFKRESDLYRLASQKEILVVAAAGNESNDNSMNPYFPASFNFQNILPIGSLSNDYTKSPFSNFKTPGLQIDVRGEDIIGYDHQGRRIKMSGTSQATARMTGDIIKFFANNPEAQLTHSIQEWVQIFKFIALSKLSGSFEDVLGIEKIQGTGISDLWQENFQRQKSLPLKFFGKNQNAFGLPVKKVRFRSS